MAGSRPAFNDKQPYLPMAAPEDNAEHTGGKLGGYGVGIAMIAIFVGMALVVAFAASDGAIFGQNFQPAPSDDVPVSDSGAEDAVALSSDAFDEGSDVGSSSPTAPPSEGDAMLSEEERRLLAMKDFQWDSVAGGHIASNQDAFQRFGQQSNVQQRPVEPGTEPLSLSDQVVVDVDRRDRGDRDRDDSDRDTLPAGIIEIDVPIGDDEDQQEEVDQPDDAPEDDQEEAPQDDDAENDRQGSDDETDDNSSSDGPGENNSGSGSSDDQSGEPGDEGDSGGSNSTGTSGSSENSGSESDAGDGNSTGTEVTVSLG